jgi:hypothetical protein
MSSGFTLPDYKLQAYLLANAEELIEKTRRDSSPSGVVNRLSGRTLGRDSVLTSAQLNTYTKKLEQNDSQMIPANALNADVTVDFVSTLPHKIRDVLTLKTQIYKVFINDSGRGPREVEIPISSYDQLRINQGEGNAASRGYLRRFDASNADTIKNNPGDPGVQIEDIEIVRLGGNPAEIDTNITVKIRLFATKLEHYFTKPNPEELSKEAAARLAAITDNDSIPEKIRSRATKGFAWIDLIKMNLEDGGINPYDVVTQRLGIDTRQNFASNIFGSSLAYNNDQQKIKLVIGYNDPSVALNRLIEQGELVGDKYTPAKIAQYAEQIKAQNEVYYLNLVQNSIDFNSEDGSVSIQIDYIASTGTNTIDRKNDLLFDPFLYELDLQANDAICAIQKVVDTEEEFAWDFQDPFGAEPDRRTPLITPEEKKASLADLDIFKKRLPVLQANKLINGLYAASLHSINDFVDEVDSAPRRKAATRSHILFAPKSEVTGKISGKLSSEAKVFNLGRFYYNYGRFGGTNPADGGQSSQEDQANVRDAVKRAQDAAQDTGVVQEVEELLDTDFPSVILPDELNIEFVFFGDLIETAFEVLAANRRLSEGADFIKQFREQSSYVKEVRRLKTGNRQLGGNMRDISLSGPYANIEDYNSQNLEFYVEPLYYNGGGDDPRIAKLYEEYGEILLSNITYKNPASFNGEVTISLADVPIAMIEFKKWFIQNISSKRKKHLFMKNYLESLTSWVSKLVGNAQSADESVTTDIEPPEMLINRYYVKDIKSNASKDFLPVITAARSQYQKFENQVSIPQLSAFIDNYAYTEADLTANVLTIIGQTPSLKLNRSRSGNQQLDREAKIPHILFAEPDNGLLYNITFQREDMPGLREARLFEGKDMYGLDILREKYNATLEFYGNNFFKPGSMLYIDPGRLNIGNLGYTVDNRSPARLLGIGGYHLVIRVTHQAQVMDNRWITTVETQWQTFGYDDGLTSRNQEENCTTSILARAANLKNLADPSDRQAVINDAIERAIQTGFTGDLEQFAQIEGTGVTLSESGVIRTSGEGGIRGPFVLPVGGEED